MSIFQKKNRLSFTKNRYYLPGSSQNNEAMKRIVWIVFLIATIVPGRVRAQETASVKHEKNHLAVLWSTGDKEVFTKMMYIYILNAKKQDWFDQVTVIVWGPSQKLLVDDPEIQTMVKDFQQAGVVMEACIWCSNEYGITENLKKLEIDVKGAGGPLTKYLKDPETEVIVF